MNKPLLSSDPTYQVRVARAGKPCYGVDKWFRSPKCTRRIRKGQLKVVKVRLRYCAPEQRFVWEADVRNYCEHCALAARNCLTRQKVSA